MNDGVSRSRWLNGGTVKMDAGELLTLFVPKCLFLVRNRHSTRRIHWQVAFLNILLKSFNNPPSKTYWTTTYHTPFPTLVNPHIVCGGPPIHLIPTLKILFRIRFKLSRILFPRWALDSTQTVRPQHGTPFVVGVFSQGKGKRVQATIK